MANSDEIKALRVLVNEVPEDSEFDDSQLSEIFDAAADMNAAAAQVWRVKAASYADLVSMSEGNSSRQWSNAYKQALEMAEVFQRISDFDNDPSSGRPTAISRKIVRT